MSNTLYIDADILKYAVTAGGQNFLEEISRYAVKEGFKIALTDAVRAEVRNSPVAAEVSAWISTQGIAEVPTKTLTMVRSGEIATKNAGELSMKEAVIADAAAGKRSVVWATDGFFQNSHANANLKGLPTWFRNQGLVSTNDMLEDMVASKTISVERHRSLVAGYQKQGPFNPTAANFSKRMGILSTSEQVVANTSPQPGGYVTKLGYGLKVLGVAGLAYDVFSSGAEAAELANQGDHSGAVQTMARLAARLYFGLQAGAAGAALGGSIGAAGGPVAIVGAVVGGIMGGVVGAIGGEVMVQGIWQATDAVGTFLQNPSMHTFERLTNMRQASGMSNHGVIPPEVMNQIGDMTYVFVDELAGWTVWDKSFAPKDLTTGINQFAAYQKGPEGTLSLTPAKVVLGQILQKKASEVLGAGSPVSTGSTSPDLATKVNYLQKKADFLSLQASAYRAAGKPNTALEGQVSRIASVLKDGGRAITALAAEYETKDIVQQKAAQATKEAWDNRQAELAAANEKARQEKAARDAAVAEGRAYLEKVLADIVNTNRKADIQKIRSALNGNEGGILGVSAEFRTRAAAENSGNSSGTRTSGGSNRGGTYGDYNDDGKYSRTNRGGGQPDGPYGTPLEKITTYKPVLLDLDGDGHIDFRPFNVAAIEAGQGPRFDWDGDGIADGTAWVGPADGWLAIDIAADGSAGPDGVIDQAKELAFTMWKTPDELAGEQITDLEAVRLVFDTNHDNLLDPGDARWSEFRVWQDANQNGVSDAGELRTLVEADIRLIELVPTSDGARQFADGSAITGTSGYLKGDGSRALVGDATISYRPSHPLTAVA